MSDKDLTTTTIDVFGNNDQSSTQVAFDFDHLEWLLKCAELGKISLKLPTQRDILEGLINCNDFLMNKQDSIVNVNSLINYFKNVKPKLNGKQRRSLLQDTNNNTLKHAMARYTKQLEIKMSQMRQELAKSHSQIQSISNIQFDSDTAFILLQQKFKTSVTALIDRHDRRRKIRIQICGFTDKSEYLNLIKHCDNTRWF